MKPGAIAFARIPLGPISCATLDNVKPGSENLGPLFSRQFFMEDILGLTSEQRIRNDRLIAEESAEILAKADAAKEEGGDENEDDDDLGF